METVTAKPIKTPGPAHPITIERNPSRVVVTLAGQVIAETARALTLREAGYPPVQYLPREDVDMAALERTQHSTYCPYTVSYTHLDVYKRQGLGQPIGQFSFYVSASAYTVVGLFPQP